MSCMIRRRCTVLLSSLVWCRSSPSALSPSATAPSSPDEASAEDEEDGEPEDIFVVAVLIPLAALTTVITLGTLVGSF